MLRTIVFLVVIGVLVYFGYYAWKSHEQKVAQTSGDYTCVGCLTPDQEARYQKENSGETPDGDTERKSASARVAAERAVEGASSSTDGSSSMTYPPPASQQPVVVPTTPVPGATPSGIPPPAYSNGLPATDSQAPNAPNGMRFAGAGAYLVYRQGDITYRLDTNTGRSCVIYATMEQWRKPLVMSHGCGRSA